MLGIFATSVKLIDAQKSCVIFPMTNGGIFQVLIIEALMSMSKGIVGILVESSPIGSISPRGNKVMGLFNWNWNPIFLSHGL
jgi:hypothetical protein